MLTCKISTYLEKNEGIRLWILKWTFSKLIKSLVGYWAFPFQIHTPIWVNQLIEGEQLYKITIFATISRSMILLSSQDIWSYTIWWISSGLQKHLFPCKQVRIYLQFDQISLQYGIFLWCTYFFQSKIKNHFPARNFLFA